MLGKNNDEHQDHIIDIEKQSQALEQYTRCSNLEISAIQNNISYEALYHDELLVFPQNASP